MSLKTRIERLESCNKKQWYFLDVTSMVIGFSQDQPIFETLDEAIDRTCREMGICRSKLGYVCFWGGESGYMDYSNCPKLENLDFGGFKKFDELYGYRSLEDLLQEMWAMSNEMA